MTAPEPTAPGRPGPAADWTALLADPAAVRELGTPAPPLADHELFLVHLDERERSATLGFTAPRVPAGAVDAWRERGHDALEFFLVLTGVRDLAADGWSHEPVTSVDLDGGTARLAGARHRITFGYDTVRAEGLRGYRAGSA